MDKYKYAIAGTSSSGKTTAAYGIVSRFKELGILADGVFSQDRRLPFSANHLETDIEAQLFILFNLIAKENELMLKKDINILISDRSIFDLYMYALVSFPHNKLLADMKGFIMSYIKSYTNIFILPPLKYHNDGVRPPVDFVQSAWKKIKSIATDWINQGLDNIIFVDNPYQIYNIISDNIIGTKKSWSESFTHDACQHIANVTKLTLVLKRSALDIKLQSNACHDIDIWIVTNISESISKTTFKEIISDQFAPIYNFDIHYTFSELTFDDLNYIIFKPSKFETT